jgi:hypothetical protein
MEDIAASTAAAATRYIFSALNRHANVGIPSALRDPGRDLRLWGPHVAEELRRGNPMLSVINDEEGTLKVTRFEDQPNFIAKTATERGSSRRKPRSSRSSSSRSRRSSSGSSRPRVKRAWFSSSRPTWTRAR